VPICFIAVSPYIAFIIVAFTGRICVKFDTGDFTEDLLKTEVRLNSGKINC
jgi:hypothetical protein